jgi:hypothetical protein
LALSSRIWTSTADATGRRPSFVPFARAREASVDPLPNDAPLELGEYPQHLEHRLAGGKPTRRARVRSVTEGKALGPAQTRARSMKQEAVGVAA